MSEAYHITNCPNCGAPIDGSGKCSYCGTVYRKENNVYIEVEHPKVKVIASDVVWDRNTIKAFVESGNEDAFSKMTLDKLANELAKGLAGYMKLEMKHPDFAHDCQIIRGSIRVVPPDFRF